MIIGITGPIGSGKDTVADYLVARYGFTRLSFAGPLKDAVAEIFHWDREALEGLTPASREWRETVDPWWSEALGIPELTPRWVLQNIGTNVMRQHFHTDIWVHSTMRQSLCLSGPVVISDARFINEARGISSAGGEVWRVTREWPKWWRHAQQACMGDRSVQAILKCQGIHESEWRMAEIDPDREIRNTGTIADLYDNVSDLISSIDATSSIPNTGRERAEAEAGAGC